MFFKACRKTFLQWHILNIWLFLFTLQFCIVLLFCFFKKKYDGYNRQHMYGRFCGSRRGSHDNYLFCTNRRITFNDIFEKNSNFTNAYIRFRFRNTLVVRNSLKVLAFSVAFCILFLVAVLGMSRFFSRTVINWNSYESYYYLCEGCISNVGFAKVVMKLLYVF